MSVHSYEFLLCHPYGPPEIRWTKSRWYRLACVSPNAVVAMNLLRSRYLSAYMSQVRPPFTSDPFPVTIIGQSAQSSSAPAYSDSSSSSLRQSGHHLTAFYDSFGRPLSTSSNSKEITPPPQQPYRGSTGKNVFSGRGRETAIFDRFIALRVGQDLRTAESELCMEGDEERDLFVRLQVSVECWKHS